MGRLGLRAKSRSTPVAGIGEGPTVPGHLPGRPRSRSGRFPPVAARDDLHEVLEVVRFQADGCARAGSPLYATILDGVAADLRADGICAQLLRTEEHTSELQTLMRIS